MLNSRLDRRPLSRHVAAAFLIALLTLSTLVAGFAGAQGFASLAGSIVDPTNGVLPNVTLILTNERSGAKYELRSDRTGRYEFVGLPPGDYGLEARIPGFAAFQGRVTLSGQNVEQNLTLQVGSLQETVTIETNDDDMPSASDADRQAAMRQPIEVMRQKRAAAKCPGAPSSGDVRIGGNLRPPMKIRDVKPRYPASLRGTGIEGAVLLKGRIGTDGILDALEVVSSPHPDLATAAVDAVAQWQFDATLLNCVAVPVELNVTVNYLYR
jgi:TonB family protein